VIYSHIILYLRKTVSLPHLSAWFARCAPALTATTCLTLFHPLTHGLSHWDGLLSTSHRTHLTVHSACLFLTSACTFTWGCTHCCTTALPACGEATCCTAHWRVHHLLCTGTCTASFKCLSASACTCLPAACLLPHGLPAAVLPLLPGCCLPALPACLPGMPVQLTALHCTLGACCLVCALLWTLPHCLGLPSTFLPHCTCHCCCSALLPHFRAFSCTHLHCLILTTLFTLHFGHICTPLSCLLPFLPPHLLPTRLFLSHLFGPAFPTSSPPLPGMPSLLTFTWEEVSRDLSTWTGLLLHHLFLRKDTTILPGIFFAPHHTHTAYLHHFVRLPLSSLRHSALIDKLFSLSIPLAP